MRKRMIAGSILVFVLGAMAGSTTKTQQSTSPGSDLFVTLSTAKETFKIDETIEVRVEIRNQGKDPLFIGNEIPDYLDWIYDLRLTLTNERGDISPILTSAGPLVLPFNRKESIAHAVSANWITLLPGYFFGRTIPIDGSIFSFLRRPGRYSLMGIYKSDGMESPVQFNRLAASPKEIASLPYRSWKGEVKTNSTLITIVPAGTPGNTSEKR
jgi:hypothetical protein